MTATIQTMRSGGTEHPENIVNFFASQTVDETGGLFGISDGDWAVSELDTPDRGVQVAEGNAYLKKTASDQMAYPVKLSGGDYEVTTTPNASGNDRIDAIVLYVDLGASANATVSNVAKIEAIEGTPGAVPVAPTDGEIATAIGVSNPFIRLADVDISNGYSQILDADITDQRSGKNVEFSLEAPTPTADDEVSNKEYVDTEISSSADLKIAKASHNLTDRTSFNLKINTEIASDELTINLEGINGNAPSATNPIYVRVEDTVLSLTSALSVTLTDSSDYFDWDSGKIQGNDSMLFIYAINNNGTLQLGASASPTLKTVAINYYDSAGQTGSAGHTNIVMSGTRHATNSCRVIGRIRVKQEDDNDWTDPDTAETLSYPIYETDILDWTPTITFTGTTAPSSINSDYTLSKYKIIGSLLYFVIYRVYGVAGSSITAETISPPASPNNFGLTQAITTISSKVVPFVNREGYIQDNIIHSHQSTNISQFGVSGSYEV